MVMERTVNMVAAVSVDVVGTEGSNTNYFITILTSVRLSWQSYSPRYRQEFRVMSTKLT